MMPQLPVSPSEDPSFPQEIETPGFFNKRNSRMFARQYNSRLLDYYSVILPKNGMTQV
jgi:hypothetical protein